MLVTVRIKPIQNQKRQDLMKTRLRIHQQLIAATTVAAALGLSACSEKSGGGSTLDKSQQSKHFEAVSAHLDLGGETYAYVDIDGDVEKLAGILNGFIDMAKKSAGDEIPPQLANLDIAKLAADLGLSGIEAMGLSSYKNGDLYRNTYYLHIPEGRTGLLKIAGGDAAPFAARKLAPAGSDLVYEQDLNLKAVFDLVQQLAGKIGGPEVAGQFAEATSQPIPQLGMTPADLAALLDTKIMVIGHIDTDKPMKLPDEVPIQIPGVDLLIAIDGLGSIFDKLTESIPEEQRAEIIKEGDGYQQIAVPLPPEMAQIIQPVIRHQKASGRVLIGTSSAYLDLCISGKSSVWEDDGFKTAMEGLPEEGNGLSFVSANFAKQYLKVYKDLFAAMAESGEMPPGVGEMVVGLMQHMGLSPDHSQGGVSVNLAEGILYTQNSVASAKQGVIAAGVGTVAVIAGAGFANVKSVSSPVEFLEGPTVIEDSASGSSFESIPSEPESEETTPAQ